MPPCKGYCSIEYFRKQHGITGAIGSNHRRKYDDNGELVLTDHKYRYCSNCAVFMIFDEATDVKPLRGGKRLFCHCCNTIVRGLSRTAYHYKRNKIGLQRYDSELSIKTDPNLGKMLSGIKRDIHKWEALLSTCKVQSKE